MPLCTIGESLEILRERYRNKHYCIVAECILGYFFSTHENGTFWNDASDDAHLNYDYRNSLSREGFLTSGIYISSVEFFFLKIRRFFASDTDRRRVNWDSLADTRRECRFGSRCDATYLPRWISRYSKWQFPPQSSCFAASRNYGLFLLRWRGAFR